MLRKDKEQVVAELDGAAARLGHAHRRRLPRPLGERARRRAHGDARARRPLLRRQEHADEARRRGGGRWTTLTALLDGPTAIAFVGDGDMVAVAKALDDTAQHDEDPRRSGRDPAGRADRGRPGRRARLAAARRRAPRPGARCDRRPADAIVGLFAAPLQDFVGLIDARIDQLGGAQTRRAEAGRPSRRRPSPRQAKRPKPRPRGGRRRRRHPKRRLTKPSRARPREEE